ncbi:MAG: hypothetical protein P9L92_17560 [Candidatus Electryonea clarkiae]|nr:hypothetical protein [Candidatus Electryonea clarkiae]MDP8287026.1 hypothetical protein [Candidatus Electryonea clarkiae]
MNKSFSIFVIALFLFIAGCSHHIQLNPNIQPNVYSIDKSDFPVGVVFTDKLSSHVEHVNPSTYVGSAHSYNFDLGSTLKSALLRSVEIAHNSVSSVNSTGEFNKYRMGYKFDLENCQIDVTFVEGFLSASAKGNVSISVSLEIYDQENGGLQKRLTISGSGFCSGAASPFQADKLFAKAVEDAIKQISEGVANALLSLNI